MVRKILYGLCLAALLVTTLFLGYMLRQEKQIRADIEKAYSLHQQSRFLRARADSLLDLKAYEEALFYYSLVDSSRGSNLTQQHATRVINLIQLQRQKSDSLFQLNRDLKQALKREFNRLIQAQHTSDTFRIKLDSLFSELHQLQNQMHAADLRESSLVDSLNAWRASHQFSQFIIDDSVKVYYLGSMDNDMANGLGVGIITSGGIYEGEWKNNNRHGKGKYTWRNGHVYDGDFFEGRIEGFGTYTFPSGEKYTGEWKNNVREGNGKFYNQTGTAVLEGIWVKDKFKGVR